MTIQLTAECSSCGNQIIDDVLGTQQTQEFVLPAGDAEYRSYEFCLCTECRRQIVEWITESEETETRIDPVQIRRLAVGLEREAANLQSVATRVRELTHAPEGDDSE